MPEGCHIPRHYDDEDGCDEDDRDKGVHTMSKRLQLPQGLKGLPFAAKSKEKTSLDDTRGTTPVPLLHIPGTRIAPYSLTDGFSTPPAKEDNDRQYFPALNGGANAAGSSSSERSGSTAGSVDTATSKSYTARRTAPTNLLPAAFLNATAGAGTATTTEANTPATEDAPLHTSRDSGGGDGNSSRTQSLQKGAAGPFTYIQPTSAKSSTIGGFAASPFVFANEPRFRHQKVDRRQKKWYGNWSTRGLILLITGIIVFVALAVGLGAGLGTKKKAVVLETSTWRPAIENTWQIQLSEPVTTPTLRASVYDLDLFDNSAETIAALQKLGRRVICYFSAGTYENWRPDAKDFPAAALGHDLADFDGERYIDIRSNAIRKIITDRIELAKTKGCDGVDPDNVDSYSVTTGFPLTSADAVDYITFMATEAHNRNVAIGLKNAGDLVNATLAVMDWEINESCVQYDECDLFQPFIGAGKPVFHIEYSDNATLSVLESACLANGTRGFSTLIKHEALGSWAVECPYGTVEFGLY